MTTEWKFKVGDLIEGVEYPSRGRVIGIEHDHYRIYWLHDSEEAAQFALWQSEIIETFYRKA